MTDKKKELAEFWGRMLREIDLKKELDKLVEEMEYDSYFRREVNAANGGEQEGCAKARENRITKEDKCTG